MMLRTLAVLGLSTATVTATMASVKDGDARPYRGTVRGTDVATDPFEELVSLDAVGLNRVLPSIRTEHVRPAVVLAKTPSEDLRIPTHPKSGDVVATGRMVVKFRNQIGAVTELFPSTRVVSRAGTDLEVVESLLSEYGATIRQWMHQSPAELAALEAKAFEHSNRIQPDLASIMVVEFQSVPQADRFLELARALNDLTEVEWLKIEESVRGASDNPSTTTPDFVAAPWETAFSIQQYQVGGPSFQGGADGADPTTWWDATQFQDFGSSFDLPRMTRLVGQTWRRYGSAPTDRDVFAVGTGGGAGFFGTLPSPTTVWLYGAEFEIIDVQDCGVDYDCADCFEVDGSPGAVKNAFNPFPEFETDPLHPEIYDNIRLCPTGRKIEVGVVDLAAFERHEEFLIDRYGDLIPEEDRPVIFEPGQTMNLVSLNEVLSPEASHGTATCGVLVAGNNDFGLVGMTWGSRVRFYPSVSTEEGARLGTAIGNAIIDLDAGSILCLPLQVGAVASGELGGQGTYGSGVCGGGQVLSSSEEYATLVRLASDAGLVVVQAAGNSGDLLAAEAGATGDDNGDTGSIVVTAVTPLSFVSGQWGVPQLGGLAPAQTRWAGSNYMTEDGDTYPGGQVMSAWGMGIPSLGYGDLFRIEDDNPFGVPPADVDPLERAFLRSYTGPRPVAPAFDGGEAAATAGYAFGDALSLLAGGGPFGDTYQGTSCAATQIAGLSVWMQGFAQLFYGGTLSGSQIRDAYLVDTTAINQGEIDSDPQLGPDNSGCFQNDSNSDSPVFLGVTPIYGMPQGPASALRVVNNVGQNFSGSIIIHWGTRIRGNAFSVGNENDGNSLAVRSRYAAQGPGPEGLTYLVSGQSTDIGVLIQPDAVAEEIISMSLTVTRRANLTVVIEIPWARNNVTGRYDPLGVELMPTVLEQGNYAFEGITSQIPAYVNGSGDVDIRLYTVGLGFIGAPTYTVEYDFIELNVNEDNAPL